MVGVSGFEKTGKAGRKAGTDGHGQAVTGDTSRVNPGQAGLHRKVIEQEAGLEIVGAIEKEVTAGKKFHGILRTKIGDDALHLDARIDGEQLAFGGDGFGERFAGVGFVKERLPLKIGVLDEVAVNDFDRTDAGANQQVCRSGTDGATADHGRARSKQVLLAFGTDPGKEHLARVFFLEKVGHGRYGLGRPCGSACYVT